MITKKHLLDSLEYAYNYTNFSRSSVTEVVLHACDFLLFSDESVWKNNTINNDMNFCLPIGSFYGSEVRSLVDLYIRRKQANVLVTAESAATVGLVLLI